MDMLRRRPLAAFFLLAFGLTWGLSATFWLIGGGDPVDASAARFGELLGGEPQGSDGDGDGDGDGEPDYALRTQIGAFVAVWAPSLAGVVMAWVCEGRAGAAGLVAKLWRRPLLRWTFAAALLIPLTVEGLAAGAGLVWSDYAAGDAALPAGPWSAVAFALGALVSGPLGEEFGWRGFALPRLVDRLGAKPAALLLSAVWALWHLPLFVVPNLQGLSMPTGLNYAALVAMLLGAGVTISWITLRAGGALGPAVVLHTTLLCAMMFVGPDPNVTVVATASALWLLAGGLLLLFAPRLGRPDRTAGVPA